MKNKGFTLVELLVVVTIIGLIAAIYMSVNISLNSGTKDKINELNEASIKEAASLIATELNYCKYEKGILDDLRSIQNKPSWDCNRFKTEYETNGLTFQLKDLNDKGYLDGSCSGSIKIKMDYASNDPQIIEKNYTCK